jgi:hypothetical protein
MLASSSESEKFIYQTYDMSLHLHGACYPKDIDRMKMLERTYIHSNISSVLLR